MKMPARSIAVVIAALAALTAPASAQTWPTQTIRLIVPFPAGGSNDVMARLIAPHLEKALGQTVVVDNRGGAGGQIGGEIVARAAPDGYTLLMGSVSTHSFAPITSPKLPYDPIKDFAPVSLFAVVQNVLVVNAALPVRDVKELVALARKSPGSLKYASGGVGSTSHFAVAMFVSVAGIGKETLHLPYKGGAPAMIATMSNETQFYLGPIPGMVPQIQSGKVRAIAITGDNRSPSLPDVPTLKELGLANAESSGWFGLMSTAGTPVPIIDRLRTAVVETTKDADVRKGLAAQGVEPVTNTPAEFAAYIADTLERYRKVVKEENLQFE